MDLEVELDQLGRRLSSHVAVATVDEFLDLVRAGEYGVALEILCDRLDDTEEPLTTDEVETIQRLAREMNLDRPSIGFIVDLAPRQDP